MARKRSEFRSRGKTGKGTDWGIAILIGFQLALLWAKLAGTSVSWWAVFIPCYILAVPLLLVIFGVSQAK